MIVQLLLALVPIALLIALGWWLRQRAFLAEHFWPQAERLGYYVLLPALFLHGMATARLDGVPVAAMVATLIVSLLAVAALLVAVRRRLPVDDAAFTSIFQGGVRFNNYVGASIAVGLFGNQGIAPRHDMLDPCGRIRQALQIILVTLRAAAQRFILAQAVDRRVVGHSRQISAGTFNLTQAAPLLHGFAQAQPDLMQGFACQVQPADARCQLPGQRFIMPRQILPQFCHRVARSRCRCCHWHLYRRQWR
ncbi:AEC family transporter [Kerstersia gyiorum]|uniref:AEC family transporter n=1 Tax=Kerstersia gyiorum TaxID=206506 RepID=UPI00209FC24C|nr:hypothetical protein [Kerstersia gyiorum]MCP1634521.1 hypothetical protein [Kerstersia gyiorum]MCP1683660.1 hypothetical protein [Kerstersia gyiorum]MCP1719330.1 hypothetical protein [Kerstersia gyiorum]MCW2186858.1 hypothetical protein [Kerstersia gyiorum]